MATRVLIVDDSATARLALKRALTDLDPDVQVVGEAARSVDALAAVARVSPDVVTMDVHLGEEDGVALAAQIMRTRPTPILVVTGVDPKDPGLAFRAVQAGALEVTAKPPGASHPDYPAARRRLVRTVKALASVPVVTRREATAPAARAPNLAQRPEVVVVGSSTGGPPALLALLGGLPPTFVTPVVIAQHVTESFGAMLATWLGGASGRRVRVASGLSELAPGEVVLAPDHAHLEFARRGAVLVREGPPRNFQRPSVDTLFESAATVYGPRAMGILLTGMGSDGAQGLLALRSAGAYTVAQEPATCVVDSMPRAAIALGAAAAVLPIERMPALLGRGE